MDNTIIAFGAGLITFWFYENKLKEKKKKKKEVPLTEKMTVNPPVTITIKKSH